MKGYVLDKVSQQPLSLAAVQIKNSQLGALTDDNGYFELPAPKTNLGDSMRISFVGYTPQTISIANYLARDTIMIYLEGQVNTKAEVPITALTAKSVLLRAITDLRKNFYKDSLVANGFYRQFHKENGTYVRLIEADVRVAFNIKNPVFYAVHELVEVNKLRRSENYETNGDTHGDHFVDLLKENPFSYNQRTFLNPKTINFFAPKFESEDSVEYIIATQYKESSSEKLEKARIWVQKETFAILRIEVEKFPNPYYLPPRYAPYSRWKLVNERDVIELEKRDGKYFVSSLERVYNHHVLNVQTRQVDYVVEESFELYFDEFENKNVGSIVNHGKFGNMTNLYFSKYNYDEKFWKDDDDLVEYPLPAQIKTDLEHAKKLEEQFREAGK